MLPRDFLNEIKFNSNHHASKNCDNVFYLIKKKTFRYSVGNITFNVITFAAQSSTLDH